MERLQTVKKLCVVLLSGLLLFGGIRPVLAQEYDGYFSADNTGGTPGYQDILKSTSTAKKDVAWSYQPAYSGYICELGAYIRKDGSPTDNIYIDVYSNDPGGLTVVPEIADNDGIMSVDGVFVGRSVKIDGSTMPSAGDTLTYFDLNGCVYMSGQSTYYFVLTREGSYSDTDHYQIGYNTGTPESDEVRSFFFNQAQNPDWDLSSVTNVFYLTGIEGYIIPIITSYDTPSYATCSFLTSSTTAETWYGRMAQDLACGIEIAIKGSIHFALYPSSSLPYVSETLTKGRETFPFSTFFSITDTFETEVAGFASSSQTLGGSISIPNHPDQEINFLWGTVLDDTFGSDFTDFWFDIVLVVAILALLFMIIKMFL